MRWRTRSEGESRRRENARNCNEPSTRDTRVNEPRAQTSFHRVSSRFIAFHRVSSCFVAFHPVAGRVVRAARVMFVQSHLFNRVPTLLVCGIGELIDSGAANSSFIPIVAVIFLLDHETAR